jgi:3-hydroxybutyryl-CoA dehydrogenase
MSDEIAGFRRVTVIGAGTMGHGIAQVCAAAGLTTILYDAFDGAAEKGVARVAGNLAKGIARGKVSEEQRDGTMARLSASDDLSAAADGADIVFEAVPEKLELKQELFTKVASVVGPEAVLATNTSSLSVTEIAKPLAGPERVIGTHFFNPVHIMKLLELIVTEQTDADMLNRVKSLGEAIGKQCIVVKDFPGFATSRLGLVIGLEAIRMVEQGVASAEDIDKAMTLGYGFPMGPLKLTDLVGLDVRLHIARYLSEHLPEGAHFNPPKLLQDMVAAGKLGKKSGQGFYEWN